MVMVISVDIDIEMVITVDHDVDHDVDTVDIEPYATGGGSGGKPRHDVAGHAGPVVGSDSDPAVPTSKRLACARHAAAHLVRVWKPAAANQRAKPIDHAPPPALIV
jgi:hypothetical protein